MKKIKLKSGAMLEITPTSFKNAKGLLNAIANEFKKINIDIDKLDMKQELNSGVINSFKSIILEIITSENIENELNKCFETCLYNNYKINEDLFDDVKLGEDARADYYFICWEVARTNLLPFMKNLNFKSLIDLIPNKSINIPK